MKKTLYECDMCHCDLEEKNRSKLCLDISLFTFDDATSEFYDLCPNCVSNLKNYIKNYYDTIFFKAVSRK